MKSARDLLQDLGFNSNASEGSKRALLRHLSQNAIATSAQNICTNPEQPAPTPQLSFAEDVLGRSTKKAK